MKNSILSFLFAVFFTTAFAQTEASKEFVLNNKDYFENQGVNVFVFSNWYNGFFSDSKMSGIEVIHHGERTVTNGDVRLSATPEQWDPIPQFVERKVDKEQQSIIAYLKYPDYNFEYMIRASAKKGGVVITVNLDQPVPKTLEGKVGFNLEFLPSAYFKKSYLMDDESGVFPLYPNSSMELLSGGVTEPLPLATGKKLVLAPEDPERRITISSPESEISLYDGRNKAQNGWFVVRSLLPSNKTGKVLEWFLIPKFIPGWIKSPMIAHSQVGYHPDQKKVAVIELDKNDQGKTTAKLLQVSPDGEFVEKLAANVNSWGNYLRYKYLTFDFTSVKENGLYVIEYDGQRTKPFRIAEDVYENVWHPTLDVYFPVQMDHMLVNEAYRVWHGASHLDDALQAPVDHAHFDLYAQGPNTDSPYKLGEHIPYLNEGGWFDAGDFDIRTQTQYHVVLNLVHTWEMFGVKRDQTLIDQKHRYVDMHHPDGKPDLLQQIEHGTLALLAQHQAVGHAISGIIVPFISQYTHLGDALTMTDNLIYNPKLDSLESDGFTSGTFDDRWAFTTKSTPLNYGSIAALAAAGRALKGYNDTLAEQSLEVAKKVWDEEHAHEPDLFHVGNTTGGDLQEEELKAAVELLITTKEDKYAKRINELWPFIESQFSQNAALAVMAMPYMDKAYAKKLRGLVEKYSEQLKTITSENPFGVPISTGGWAGNGQVVGFALTNYLLHKSFPDIIDREYALSGLNYLYGCHPGSNVSFVSGVGTVSKMVAYGNNRADFSFIAGGVVPGVLILPPDFPENKEDWPFLWGENEYVVNVGSSYIFLANAIEDLLGE